MTTMQTEFPNWPSMPLDERTICAEFQRSILVVTRGMDFD